MLLMGPQLDGSAGRGKVKRQAKTTASKPHIRNKDGTVRADLLARQDVPSSKRQRLVGNLCIAII